MVFKTKLEPHNFVYLLNNYQLKVDFNKLMIPINIKSQTGLLLYLALAILFHCILHKNQLK